MSTTPTESKRWSPWWAIALAVIALIPPVVVIVLGIREVFYARSRQNMWELAEALAPIIIALGVVGTIPAILYLIYRRSWLLVLALIIALFICALPFT